MKTLHVNVANKIATYQKRDGAIVCGNSDYQVKFTFDEEWAEHNEKTARFIWNGLHEEKKFTGDTCEVPIIRGARIVKVGVYAGNLRTTTSALVPALPSVLCGGEPPTPENDKRYANEAKEAAEKAEEAAAFVALNGGKSAYGFALDGGYTGTEAEFAEDINPDNIKANAQNFIATELAKREQLKPEFANRIEECTDITKLYVLPDGYIYANINVIEKVEKTETKTRTLTVDDFAQGYFDKSGNILDRQRAYTPEYLPCTLAEPWKATGNGTDFYRIMYYDKDKKLLGLFSDRKGDFNDEEGVVDGTSEGSIDPAQVAYVRFTLRYVSDPSELDLSDLVSRFTFTRTYQETTYDEIITKTWANTGHAFVPADYEDRILELEDAKEKQEELISELDNNKQPKGNYATEAFVLDAMEAVKASIEDEKTETKTRTLTVSDFEQGLFDTSGNILDRQKAYTPEYLECTLAEPWKVVGNGADYYRILYYDKDKHLLGIFADRKGDFNSENGVVDGAIMLSPAVTIDPAQVAYVRFSLWYAEDPEKLDLADLVSRFTITRTYEEIIPCIDTSDFATKSDLGKIAEEVASKQPKGDYATERYVRAEATKGSYNRNFVFNERIIRSIANLRDSDKSKDFEIAISNNSGGVIKNAAIVVGIHNKVGVNPANNNLPFQVYDDVFSESVGFKFFDQSGEELPYYIESESNCNYIVDKNIKNDQKTMAVFSNGKIAVYNSEAHRVQMSADDGVTWTNICDNITKWPYRILIPDSRDNFFVASNDGYKLYKYTAADGYKAGTEVIDLTGTNTKIGSILAEDSDHNLYLGVYQNPEESVHCVIRKSTDGGNTWEIVFDNLWDEYIGDSENNHHVHNIYINKNVTPNEIFIGLDGPQQGISTYVSTDAGATWTLIDVPYGNGDYAFRYAGENFYIGGGERLYLGGATLYKTTDYNDPNAYYPLFDNGQGMRDVTNVIEGSDDVLIAGGCADAAVNTQQLFLSEDRGETWKTVLISPSAQNQAEAGKGLRTFSRKGNEILSETSTAYAMRFVYGNGAKTTLAIVNVGDIPKEGKTVVLKTGYVANVEQMDKVLTAYESIEGKVADIQVCDGYVIDKVSNKRVVTDKTELVDSRIKIGQTSEYKILSNVAYRLNGSVNLGKLSRLTFTKGFTVSLLFRREEGWTLKDYLSGKNTTQHVIFQTGEAKLVLYQKSLRLMYGDSNVSGNIPMNNVHFLSVNEDYIRVTVYFTADALPSFDLYTENLRRGVSTVSSYPIDKNFSDNDFIIGNALGSAYGDIPNITRIEIYNRVLAHGEIMSLTSGCNLVTDGSEFN